MMRDLKSVKRNTKTKFFSIVMWVKWTEHYSDSTETWENYRPFYYIETRIWRMIMV
jgi:hypothetical protein